jgi:hypothetical protein
MPQLIFPCETKESKKEIVESFIFHVLKRSKVAPGLGSATGIFFAFIYFLVTLLLSHSGSPNRVTRSCGVSPIRLLGDNFLWVLFET